MMHLPANSIPTRLDASQGAQFHHNASFDSASVHSTMYQVPGVSCPPSTLHPNFTLPEPPLSATLYGAGGTSPMPNYQDQDTISLAVNFTTNSTFVARPSLSQGLYGAGGVPSVPNYYCQDNVRPGANLIPNSTFVARPLLSQGMHGASGSSSSSNHRGQGNVYSAANLPTFVARPSLSQDMRGASGASSAPHCYDQDNVRPAANLTPNAAFVAHPSLSQDFHGASGASSVPNYYDQYNISPAENLNLTSISVAHPSLIQYMCDASDTSNYQVTNGPTFPPTNVTLPILPMSTQESCQPFSGMLPSDANMAFLQSEGNGSHDHTASLISQMAPMEAPVTAGVQQTMYQVSQSVVQEEPSKEPGSAHEQIDVTSDEASSARQMSPQREQWKNLPGFQLRVKNKLSKTRRNANPSTSGTNGTNENGREQYYCDLCEKFVLVHRKKFHNRKHAPNAGEFVCKICEVLEEPCEPLSRKDALKRHIKVKHPLFSKLLRNRSLRLLVPRRKNESEDLKPLLQAMLGIS